MPSYSTNHNLAYPSSLSLSPPSLSVPQGCEGHHRPPLQGAARSPGGGSRRSSAVRPHQSTAHRPGCEGEWVTMVMVIMVTLYLPFNTLWVDISLRNTHSSLPPSLPPCFSFSRCMHIHIQVRAVEEWDVFYKC